jgi:hypothetical protein
MQTSVQSSWQNGVVERWVGSCRRELLDYVIALNERHLNTPQNHNLGKSLTIWQV